MTLTRKSRSTSFLLTLLLGPLGLFYASPIGGLILCLVAIFTAPTIIGPVVCWFLAICIGDHCAHKHNEALREFSDMMRGKVAQ
jgi:hypothetical protein